MTQTTRGPAAHAAGGQMDPGARSKPKKDAARVQPRHLQFTFEDPLSSLPETARHLLLAAKLIVARDGFARLTLDAVALESGENKAMIPYYFRNKAGLVAALLDSVIHDEYLASVNRMRGVPKAERASRLLDEMRRMDAARDEFRVFFELLPHALRDEVLRQRLSRMYHWYRAEKLAWLGHDTDAELSEEVLGLSQLLGAMIDGLAIQQAVDPEGLDISVPYRVLEMLLEEVLMAVLTDKGSASV